MKKTLTIEGMTCHNCVRHTTEALREVEGVTSVTVDLGRKTAVVEAGGDVADETLKNAVAEAGYTVTAVKAG